MKIAIVGTGISGLVAARLLHREHEVTLFEASDRIGGHTHTHEIRDAGKTLAIDSGFIVFNEHNYPNFTRLLRMLGVASKPSNMGFSVRDDRDGLEYAGRSMDHLFAQRRNLFKPSFHRMLWDLLRFYREAPRELQANDRRSLGAYLEEHGYGRRFVEQHILPMGAALWSCGEDQMLDFPASFFVEFMANHRMLSLRGRPEWRVIDGGSSQYLEPLARPFRERIRVSTPVESIDRATDGVRVRAAARVEHFDEIVLACHSDQALRLLGTPTSREREILGQMPYSSNPTALHTDSSVLPRRSKVRSAWNYRVGPSRRSAATVTYHMNTLQGLPSQQDFCVTLNGREDIDRSRILATMDYEHPQYTMEGVRARERWDELSGRNRTHYCGAYWGWGFHEDGVLSALRVGQHFGQKL